MIYLLSQKKYRLPFTAVIIKGGAKAYYGNTLYRIGSYLRRYASHVLRQYLQQGQGQIPSRYLYSQYFRLFPHRYYGRSGHAAPRAFKLSSFYCHRFLRLPYHLFNFFSGNSLPCQSGKTHHRTALYHRHCAVLSGAFRLRRISGR